MGFMDKAKEAAEKAKAQAQQIAQQGQAKVQDVQRTRSEHELYQNLGEAYYAQQRRGGDATAVTAALDALDAHFAGGGGSAPASGNGQGGPSAPPAGDFKIEDV